MERCLDFFFLGNQTRDISLLTPVRIKGNRWQYFRVMCEIIQFRIQWRTQLSLRRKSQRMMVEHVLPNRIFAFGDEPSGQRVNSYHKMKRTEFIIDALEQDEILYLRNSTFGKVISIYENPPFSGAFGHFILVRRLKTNKKYEIWILFAGFPIRFSLREFTIVTGLNCGRIPPASRKRKNPLKEKPY